MKNAPATKLPWKDLAPATEMMRSHIRETNLAYAVHAVNAYPLLIEKLAALADDLKASGMDSTAYDIRRLLEHFGEGA